MQEKSQESEKNLAFQGALDSGMQEKYELNLKKRKLNT